MNMAKKFLGLIIILVISFWAIRPLFSYGFFPMHDDTQIARVFEMGKSLGDGMFPVRWVADLGYGYGYPIFNFYAPLAYYIGGFFTLLGFDALLATKIMMGLGIILSSLFMYLFARAFWGEIGGVVAGVFYIYTPYHALDIYVRGDVAEFWAFAFIPLAFYGLRKIYEKKKWGLIIGALGYAGIILSHNLTAMMVTPFLLTFVLIQCYIAQKGEKLSTLNFQLSTLFLGLFLSGFYWIPAILEMQYTNVFSQIGGGADFRNHFVCPLQLWDSLWGFGGSAPGCIDGLSFKIGKLHLVVSALSLVLGAILLKRDKLTSGIILFSVFSILFSILLTLKISKPIWEVIYPMAFFQYPWRFLLIASFFSSFLAGSIPWVLKLVPLKAKYFSSVPHLGSAILIFLLLYFNGKLFIPQTILLKTASDYTNNLAIRWVASKTSDEYMPKDFLKPKSEKDIVMKKITSTNNIRVTSYEEKTHRLSAQLEVKEDSMFPVSVAYFPAWKVFVDNKPALFSQTSKGLHVMLSVGKHGLDVRFEETEIEKLANTLSLIGFMALIIGIILLQKKRL